MAQIIHETRLFCLAIILPALFVAAGGAWLLHAIWRQTSQEERADLDSRAELFFHLMHAEAARHGFEHPHGPPRQSTGPRRPPPGDETRQPGPQPTLRPRRPIGHPVRDWTHDQKRELPALCSAALAAMPTGAASTAFAVLDANGRRLYATDHYPAGEAVTGSCPLAPPFPDGTLVATYPDGGAATHRRHLWILLVGIGFISFLILTPVAGGLIFMHIIRRERLDARRKTDFVDNVSHELKTPLAGIRLNAELLTEGRIPGKERQLAALNAILIESDRLTRMVDNLLDFSRLEKGRRSYAIETFDLAAFAGSAPELQAIEAISSGRAHVTVKRPGVMVSADPNAIRQIGVNLVVNALKYSEGEIDIEVEGSKIRYMDRGPGIPHGDEERIFDRFYRVDNSLTQKASGSGLGLPIARALARGMGGDLAYSPRPGGGSIFTLSLKEAGS